MLQTIGVQTIDELFSDIPESVRFKGDLKIKEAKSEPELLKELSQMASKNANLKEYASFLGAGVYASLRSSNCRSCYLSLRILYSLHAIPTRNFTRGITSNL